MIIFREWDGISLILLYSQRLFSYGPLYESVIPCLEFSIEFQYNKLIPQKEYTKRQQIIYLLIHYLHDREGWGYQKISNWLNKSSMQTHTGKNWFTSSVISVLKRKYERDLMNEQIRNQHFTSKISKFGAIEITSIAWTFEFSSSKTNIWDPLDLTSYKFAQ